jgi:hypothetical protein
MSSAIEQVALQRKELQDLSTGVAELLKRLGKVKTRTSEIPPPQAPWAGNGGIPAVQTSSITGQHPVVVLPGIIDELIRTIDAFKSAYARDSSSIQTPAQLDAYSEQLKYHLSQLLRATDSATQDAQTAAAAAQQTAWSETENARKAYDAYYKAQQTAETNALKVVDQRNKKLIKGAMDALIKTNAAEVLKLVRESHGTAPMDIDEQDQLQQAERLIDAKMFNEKVLLIQEKLDTVANKLAALGLPQKAEQRRPISHADVLELKHGIQKLHDKMRKDRAALQLVY